MIKVVWKSSRFIWQNGDNGRRACSRGCSFTRSAIDKFQLVRAHKVAKSLHSQRQGDLIQPRPLPLIGQFWSKARPSATVLRKILRRTGRGKH